MKIALYKFILILCCLGEIACIPQDDYLETDSMKISGYECKSYDLASRTIKIENEETTLKNGSQISFYLKGDIQTETQLELENGLWKGELPDLSNSNPTTVTATAIYPFLENYNNLYSKEGELTDIWYDEQETSPYKIELKFKHLFSRLSIELSESLQSSLEQITIIPQQKVAALSLFPIKLEYADTELPTTCLKKNTTGIYTLNVPPHENQTCVIALQMSDGKILSTKIQNQQMKGGVHYYCKISSKEDGKGIYTAEDFIAFSYLMIGKTYGNRTLDEFYTEKDGIRTFHLRSDIVFNEELSSQIQKIAMGASMAFNDIFNGNNHTISGIIFKNNRTENGLFTHIGKSGVIENLILDNMTINCTTHLTAGLISVYNKGTIRNCKIKNSLISSSDTESNMVGLICNSNTGIIYNCMVSNSAIECSSNNIGGIVRGCTGTMLNCLAINIDLSKCNEKGGFCSSIKGTIHNCYIYDKGAAEWEKYGSFTNTISEGSINNCFGLEEGNKKAFYKISGGTITNCRLYPETEGAEIIEQLNSWIETTGKELYPDKEFKKWILSPDGIPNLQN